MRTWWVFVFVLLTIGRARAQDAPPDRSTDRPSDVLGRASITGSVRAAYWSSTRNLDDEAPLGAGMVWIKSSRRLSDRVSFLAEGWAALRGPIDHGDTNAELREAYLDLRFKGLDVRAGRQIIAWGRADGINPTDNLSGQDFRLLTPDDADRRLGTTALRASYYLGDVSLTGVWLPEFRGHEFALPAPPAGGRIVEEDLRWPGNQWAIRAEQTGRAMDWSISYFRGRDMAPDLGLGDDDAAHVIRLSHHPLQVVGADMATNRGRFGLRAEGAYVRTADPQGRDPFTKSPYVFIVAGADRTFRGLLNMNLQYLFRYVHGDPPALPEGIDFASEVANQQAIVNNQVRRVQHGASVRIGYKWLHETLEGECAAAAYAEPSGATVRPKVTYAINDHWKALAGIEVFRGAAASSFGLLRRNSTGYVEARWSF
jgi:hypothetical protein